ncbi:MAG: hypothetical protein KC431_29155, partial [Myxococcales bacterium]|nr:hypothetical protein [Myxococcales bacterium]
MSASQSASALARAVLEPIAAQAGDRGLLSPAQQRVWFVEQMHGDRSLYGEGLVLTLRGELDADALARALQRVVDRHAVLRSVFHEREGEPIQVVHPTLTLALTPIDLRALAEPAREQAARRHVTALVRPRFDLVRGPLIRAALLRITDGEHRLVLALHHLIFDGWSTGVLLGELAQGYAALREGREPALPELPIQFGDWVRWQRQLSEQSDLGPLCRRLAGFPQVLALSRRPPGDNFAGRTWATRLDGALARRIRERAAAQGATAYHWLLACYAVVLQAWSGQERFIVGSPMANRLHPQAAGLIGFFANTMAIPCALAAALPFTALVEQLRDSTLALAEHAHLPFDRVVDALGVDRSTERSPLVQVMFAYQESPTAGLRLADLEV